MRTALLLLCLVALPASAGAQTIDVDTGRSTILFEILHPFYEEDDSGIASGAYFLSGRIPASQSAAFMFEVPFAYYDPDDNAFVEGTSSTIGNPMVGLSLQATELAVDLGVRPSLADEEEFASIYGWLTDLSRWEAFVPELTTIFAQLRVERVQNGLSWGVNAGPTVWIPTESDADKEVFLDYGGALGHASSSFRLTLRLKGKFLLTESDLDLGERTLHQLGFFSDFGSGPVNPGISLLLHLDEDYEPTTTLGLSVKLVAW